MTDFDTRSNNPDLPVDQQDIDDDDPFLDEKGKDDQNDR